MAVLTWRNVNAPSGAALGGINAAQNQVSRGFNDLNASLDKFQTGRSNMAEASVAQRMLQQQDYDGFREAQQSGQLMEGVNPNHLTAEALGRINEYGDNLLRRTASEEALSQSRTTFGNNQDDRASEEAASPIVAQLYQAASNGDTNTVNRLYAEHGDVLSSVPLDRLQSIATGSMGLEQGRSGINNQLHSQRMSEANYGLAARRVANAEANTNTARQTEAQKVFNQNLTDGFVNLLGRSATSPEDFERLYEAEIGNNPDIPVSVKQNVWEQGINLFPGSYGIGSASNSGSGGRSSTSGENATPIADPDLSTARTALADINFDTATRGAPTYYRSMMANIDDPSTTAEVTQNLKGSVAADIPETDISSAIERVRRETGLPPAAAGAVVNDAIGVDRSPFRDGIEMALRGPAANLQRYGINPERLEASITEIASNKPQDNLFVDQLGQEFNAEVQAESNRLEQLLRQKSNLERRAENNPRLQGSLENLNSEIQDARSSLRRILESDTQSRSLLQ